MFTIQISYMVLSIMHYETKPHLHLLRVTKKRYITVFKKYIIVSTFYLHANDGLCCNE